MPRHKQMEEIVTWYEPTHLRVRYVCTYFLSHKCVYRVHMADIIGYNLHEHLRHTFMTLQNQQFGGFENQVFLSVKNAEIVDFLELFWYVMYPYNLYIWSLSVFGQLINVYWDTVCAQMWHTLHFPAKICWMFSQIWASCMPCGAHILSHYTFFRVSDMVRYHYKVSVSYTKWKGKR